MSTTHTTCLCLPYSAGSFLLHSAHPSFTTPPSHVLFRSYNIPSQRLFIVYLFIFVAFLHFWVHIIHFPTLYSSLSPYSCLLFFPVPLLLLTFYSILLFLFPLPFVGSVLWGWIHICILPFTYHICITHDTYTLLTHSYLYCTYPFYCPTTTPTFIMPTHYLDTNIIFSYIFLLSLFLPTLPCITVG